MGAQFYRLWKSGHFSEARSLCDVIDTFDSHMEISSEQDEDVERSSFQKKDCRRPLLADSRSSSPSSPSSSSPTPNNEEDLGANYFAVACLQFTTVSSTTILNSTSGIWTLLFSIIGRVEKFTPRKLYGVLISLVGIICISRVDLSDKVDDTGSFPKKSTGEMALGDSMAALSAILYGVYTVVMKRQVGDESAVNMTLFFGL
ncbi:hypothetical protein KEM54_006638, partial [Ascosphaera aggregata]